MSALRLISRNDTVTKNSAKLDNDTLQQLIAAVATNQDRLAFKRLYDHFSPLIAGFAWANPYGDNPGQFGDELTQESMIKVWNKAGSFNPAYASVNAWVFTIIRNTRIDLIRKNNRYSMPLDSGEIMEMDIPDEAEPELFQQVLTKQNETMIKESLEQLPNDYRQVIAKAYMEGKSHSEIAMEMDLPLGTVKSRIRLALNKLKVLVVH